MSGPAHAVPATRTAGAGQPPKACTMFTTAVICGALLTAKSEPV
ncbi:hypothetical protein J2Z21_000811 [Streptomyces griseochromogenes]|uniref:Uncharacterized protein n=1 Tax=Streptomyces griseochromogenes TaxID=68214 RepID=A0ABS4LKH0_9ACTN|nr:hypothetical protein [Streptomyces griseochromogenes]